MVYLGHIFFFKCQLTMKCLDVYRNIKYVNIGDHRDKTSYGKMTNFILNFKEKN